MLPNELSTNTTNTRKKLENKDKKTETENGDGDFPSQIFEESPHIFDTHHLATHGYQTLESLPTSRVPTPPPSAPAPIHKSLTHTFEDALLDFSNRPEIPVGSTTRSLTDEEIFLKFIDDLIDICITTTNEDVQKALEQHQYQKEKTDVNSVSSNQDNIFDLDRGANRFLKNSSQSIQKHIESKLKAIENKDDPFFVQITKNEIFPKSFKRAENFFLESNFMLIWLDKITNTLFFSADDSLEFKETLKATFETQTELTINKAVEILQANLMGLKRLVFQYYRIFFDEFDKSLGHDFFKTSSTNEEEKSSLKNNNLPYVPNEGIELIMLEGVERHIFLMLKLIAPKLYELLRKYNSVYVPPKEFERSKCFIIEVARESYQDLHPDTPEKSSDTQGNEPPQRRLWITSVFDRRLPKPTSTASSNSSYYQSSSKPRSYDPSTSNTPASLIEATNEDERGPLGGITQADEASTSQNRSRYRWFLLLGILFLVGTGVSIFYGFFIIAYAAALIGGCFTAPSINQLVDLNYKDSWQKDKKFILLAFGLLFTAGAIINLIPAIGQVVSLFMGVLLFTVMEASLCAMAMGCLITLIHDLYNLYNTQNVSGYPYHSGHNDLRYEEERGGYTDNSNLNQRLQELSFNENLLNSNNYLGSTATTNEKDNSHPDSTETRSSFSSRWNTPSGTTPDPKAFDSKFGLEPKPFTVRRRVTPPSLRSLGEPQEENTENKPSKPPHRNLRYARNYPSVTNLQKKLENAATIPSQTSSSTTPTR